MKSNDPSWVSPCVLDVPGVNHVIRLVPLEAAHAPDLFAAADEGLFAHTMQAPDEWSVAGFARDIERVRAFPASVAFAMVLKSGPQAGRAIGRTTFMDIKPEHRGLEIGRTWISRAYHGTRVNPEAKYLMLRHAFEVLAPTALRVQITTSSSNVHSQTAIAKLGAVREGQLRKARVMPAQLGRAETLVREWVIFSVLDDEWGGVKARLEQRLAAMPA